MFWIFLIAIIIAVVLVINKEHKEVVKKNVVNYGGMRVKYAELISYLSQGAAMSKETKDSIALRSSNMAWYLDLVGDEIEIKMTGYMPMLGKVSHKWVYPHDFPQNKMIQDIENYVDWTIKQFVSSIENNPNEYSGFELNKIAIAMGKVLCLLDEIEPTIKNEWDVYDHKDDLCCIAFICRKGILMRLGDNCNLLSPIRIPTGVFSSKKETIESGLNKTIGRLKEIVKADMVTQGMVDNILDGGKLYYQYEHILPNKLIDSI